MAGCFRMLGRAGTALAGLVVGTQTRRPHGQLPAWAAADADEVLARQFAAAMALTGSEFLEAVQYYAKVGGGRGGTAHCMEGTAADAHQLQLMVL